MHSKPPEPPVGLDSLWGVAPPQQRGPAPRFTTTDVADAAVGLADSEGLSAVTLGAVAKRLGLTTTALYRYVESKDVLMELMADRALGEPPPMGGLDWAAAARTWAQALRHTYLQHPWLALIPPSGPPRRPGPYAWMAQLVARLDGATRHRPAAVVLMLDCLVRGYAGVGGHGTLEPWLGQAVATRFPLLQAAPADDWSNGDEEFEEALETLLRGLSAAPSTVQP